MTAYHHARRTLATDAAQTAAFDEGLRAHMLRVYNYMCLGIALTAGLSMLIAMDQALLETVQSYFLLIFIGVLLLGLAAPAMAGSPFLAQAMFWTYAALWGVLLAPMMSIYAEADPMLIARAFFITAGTFAGMSLYGYTTRKNLGPMGGFLVMATMGLLIALLTNVFLFQDSGLQLLLSIIVVLVFSGLTAVQTQAIKNDYSPQADNKAITGAFLLYGSFITLFIYILSILGLARSD